MTLNDFVERANGIHNNKYSYSEYFGAHSPINIECEKHGIFKKTPSDHLKGSGCPHCKKEEKRDKLIIRFKDIHGDKYNYDLIGYDRLWNRTLSIVCECGVFKTTARLHLKGSGCPSCDLNKRRNEFIRESKAIHGDKYNYSDINYNNIFDKIKLNCEIHGNFEVFAMNHLYKGAGCPRCSKNGFNPDKPAILYYIWDPQEDLYKIGITNNSIEERFGKEFCSKRAIALFEQTYENGQDAYLAEQEILEAFNYIRCENPSWPETKGGRTEFFKEDILKLNKI